ncbi:MAG: hypothetical protein EA401_05150 [Planctomycetota bacterium]|nr:MAG: hypothetical protein EA401_05150 [Planctomycetota bacterium]
MPEDQTPWKVVQTQNSAEAEHLLNSIDENASLVLVFASPKVDCENVAKRCHARWGQRVIGCTTAGEIGPQGYGDHGLSICAFAANTVISETVCIKDLHHPNLTALAHWQRRCQGHLALSAAPMHGIAILLCDGLCQCEEHLAAQIRSFVPDCPLIGASAGDDALFHQTGVLHQGAFASNQATLTWIASTQVSFETLHLNDFTPISDDMVITKAQSSERTISEIDGFNALEIYRKHLGDSKRALDINDFAMHSLMLTIGGKSFVRSVRSATADGTLIMHSAIDEGMLVRIGRTGPVLPSLQASIATATADPNHLGMLHFDCIHRRLELQRLNDLSAAHKLLQEGTAGGFVTYGEISEGLHVNQTCTGMRIRRASHG